MHRQRCVASRSERALTGPAALDTRFPGQWFQIESGLHDNWHRHYDPTTGRYTQPDPLGFVDGPGVFAYAVCWWPSRDGCGSSGLGQCPVSVFVNGYGGTLEFGSTSDGSWVYLGGG
ncbi:MAG: RHS repeat-associated core domain-containing protein [Hyphomicrobiaceae bacterium]